MNDVFGRRRQKGVSIIELMIGMTMGLLISIALVRSFSSNEVFSRAVSGRADAQMSGAMAFWRMNRELRLSGSGIGHGPNLWGCPLRVSKNSTTLLPASTPWPEPFASTTQTLRLVPIAVRNDTGPGGSDQLIMMAGSPGANVVPTPANIFSAASIDLNTTTGFSAGDLLIMNDASAAGDCYLGQIDNTFVPAAAGMAAPTTVPTTNAGAPFNHASGFMDLVAATPAGDFTVVNIGATPVIQMVGMNERNELVVYDPLQIYTGATPLPVAQNIVQFQALYGVDDGTNGGTLNDNVIDDWVVPDGIFGFDNVHAEAGNSLWIKAVRIAMLTRSTTPSGNQSPAQWTLFPDQPVEKRFLVDIATDKRRFSHEVFDIIVPLRNQVSALCSQERRVQGIPSSTGCT